MKKKNKFHTGFFRMVDCVNRPLEGAVYYGQYEIFEYLISLPEIHYEPNIFWFAIPNTWLNIDKKDIEYTHKIWNHEKMKKMIPSLSSDTIQTIYKNVIEEKVVELLSVANTLFGENLSSGNTLDLLHLCFLEYEEGNKYNKILDSIYDKKDNNLKGTEMFKSLKYKSIDSDSDIVGHNYLYYKHTMLSSEEYNSLNSIDKMNVHHAIARGDLNIYREITKMVEYNTHYEVIISSIGSKFFDYETDPIVNFV